MDGDTITDQRKNKKLTLDEQIEKHEATLKQLKNKKKMVDNREKEKERKARTHRLCEYGGLVEKYLINYSSIAPEMFEALLGELVSLPGVGDFLNAKNTPHD